MKNDERMVDALHIQPLNDDLVANLSIEELEGRLEMQILHLTEAQFCYDCSTRCAQEGCVECGCDCEVHCCNECAVLCNTECNVLCSAECSVLCSAECSGLCSSECSTLI